MYAIFFLLMLLLAPSARAEDAILSTTSGSGSAVEGDILSVNGQVVKLWGIDAPEAGQPCSDARGQAYDCFARARDTLKGFIGQNSVVCFIRGQDMYGQKVGTCAVGQLDLAALMVRAGWAMAYYGLTPTYLDLEGDAQSNFRGMWSGKLQPPWIWKARNSKK